jgi:hypothetical protein
LIDNASCDIAIGLNHFINSLCWYLLLAILC